jgi:hypothetical protein
MLQILQCLLSVASVSLWVWAFWASSLLVMFRRPFVTIFVWNPPDSVLSLHVLYALADLLNVSLKLITFLIKHLKQLELFWLGLFIVLLKTPVHDLELFLQRPDVLYMLNFAILGKFDFILKISNDGLEAWNVSFFTIQLLSTAFNIWNVFLLELKN